MKNIFPIFLFTLVSISVFAQKPEDALRLAWLTPGGSARQQAISGAMVSLGGDISSNFVNPAGLGLYKTGELVLSPGLASRSTAADYLGTASPNNKVSSFLLGSSGVVFAGDSPDDNGMVFSIAVQGQGSLSGNTGYSGLNNYSSFSEQYSEEFAGSGLSINNAINNPQVSYGTRMALYTYLVDTATVGGTLQVIGQPQKILASNGYLHQVYSRTSKGSVNEIAISLAGNYGNKFYLGGSLGIPIVSYRSDLSLSETDATGNTNNDFASCEYLESYTSKGAGVNIKVGAIYIPAAAWRIGLAIHTPTVYSLTDKTSASMNTNTEGYAGSVSISSSTLDEAAGVNSGNLKYDLTGPWRFMVGGSYLVGGGELRQNQKGFITADIEYATTRSPKFRAPQIDNNNVDDSYFAPLNSATKSFLKNSFSFRLGGEMKFDLLAARAGLSYYTSPYQDPQLQAGKFYFSGGLGYRNKGVFVDLAYVQGLVRDVSVPYHLEAKASPYAQIKQTTRTLLLTMGFKF